MRKTPLLSVNQMTEINLTPLIDLTFMLLITFIITFPLIEQGIPVRLPKGRAQDISQQDFKTISIDRHGTIYLENARVSHEELALRMAPQAGTPQDAAVMIRADERISYGDVVKVLRILHGIQITRIALVTEGEGK